MKIIAASLSKVVNGLRFTSDGTKILASTTAKRMAVIDIEHGEQIQGYDNCTFNGRDRAAIAVDSTSSVYVATTCPNGRWVVIAKALFEKLSNFRSSRGITVIDLRVPLPLDFIADVRISFVFLCFETNCLNKFFELFSSVAYCQRAWHSVFPQQLAFLSVQPAHFRNSQQRRLI